MSFSELQQTMQHKAPGEDNTQRPPRESRLPIKSKMQSGSTLENGFCFALCIHGIVGKTALFPQFFSFSLRLKLPF